MLPKFSKPKGNDLYKASDYANVAVHYAATGALVVGGVVTSIVLGQPMLALYALGFTGLTTVMGIKLGKKLIEKGTVPYKADDPDAVGLAAIAQELYQRTGLKADNNPIYDFMPEQAEAREKTEESQKRNAEMGSMGMMPNAMAMNFDKPMIMITRPLLKMLNAEEEKAVLAHEFTHAAARHTHTGLIQGAGATFAIMAAGFSTFTVALSGGWLPYLASVGSSLGIQAASAFIGQGDMKQHLHNWKTYLSYMRRPKSEESRKLSEELRTLEKERRKLKEELRKVDRELKTLNRALFKDKITIKVNKKYEEMSHPIWAKRGLLRLEISENSDKQKPLQKELKALYDKEWEAWAEKTGYKKFPAPSLQQLTHRKFIGRIGTIGAIAAGTALLTAAVGPVYLGYMAASWGIGYAGILLTKHFQQSNELQADKKVIELGADPLALVTALRKLEIVNKQSVVAAYDSEAIPKKGRLTRIWTNLNASHPATSVRIKKLAAMARKEGYAEADIQAATDGAITLGAEHNIPPALIRMQISR